MRVVDKPISNDETFHVCETPKNSHSGNGPVDQYNGEFSYVARTLRAELQDKANMEITENTHGTVGS